MARTASIDEVLAMAGNEDLLEELGDRIRRHCVVPFVGAGLSVPFGYPAWSKLLQTQGELYGLLDDVNNELAAGRYEEAAAVLADDPDTGPVFQELIGIEFKPTRQVRESRIGGAPKALTALVRGPVVTTNYDDVLERVFDQQGRPFAAIVRPTDASMLCDAFSGNHHYLLKIHGHYKERSSRILTLAEYERYYGASTAAEIDPSLPLPQALRLMFQGRSVLFLGCSLQEDRYLRMLRRLVATGLYTPIHFALLEDKGDAQTRRRRLSRDRILPIFFPEGRFDLIETILQHLGRRPEPMRGEVRRGEVRRDEGLREGKQAHADDAASWGTTTGSIASLVPPSGIPASAVPPGLAAAFDARRCVGFIGSGASFDAGLPTWSQLAHDLVTMAADSGKLADAEVVELRNRIVHGEMPEVIDECMVHVPQRVHRAIATRFDARGLDSPTHDLLAEIPFRAIVTTNYDTFLESRRPRARVLAPDDIAALGAPGERRLLDDATEQPILKIHGTAVEPAKILISMADYQRFADRAPGYRDFLVQLFSRWTLFFYGSSLRDERVLELLEAAHQRARSHGPRHYGILMRAAAGSAAQLRDRFGIEVIDADEGFTPPQARALLRALARR